MTDSGRELTDLKKEIIEARNQVIKTDNQVKNLSLDIKSFEKRFGVLERRTRLASISANIIVALVIAAAAYLVHHVRVSNLTTQIERSQQDAQKARQQAVTDTESLTRRVNALESEKRRRQEVEAIVAQLLLHLDEGQERSAEKLLESIDLQAVGPAIKSLAEKRIQEFRRRSAEQTYRNARSLISAGRTQAAIAELRRSIRFEPSGRHSTYARYQLATGLWSAKRYDEAAVVLREMQTSSNDKSVVEEARWLLGASLARAGDREEAAKILKAVVASQSKFVPQAKSYLAAIEGGGELPPLPAGRNRATVSRPAALTTSGSSSP